MSGSAFAEFIESGLESAREFFSRSSAPVMEEDHSGAVSGHVMVNGNHIQTVLAKGFQNRRHFLFEHRDVTGNRRVFLRADKRGPRVQSHAGVDHSPVLFHTEVIASHGDLVHRARLLALVPSDFCKLGGIERCAAAARGSSRFGFNVTNEVQPGFHPPREVSRFSHAVDVHVKDVRIIPEEMIVESRHIDSVVEQHGEDGIDFFLKQYQVTHHRLRSVCRFGQRDPASETKRRRRRKALDGHLQIVARNIYLENASLEVAFSVQALQNLLVVTRDFLSWRGASEREETSHRKEKHGTFANETTHGTNLLWFFEIFFETHLATTLRSSKYVTES